MSETLETFLAKDNEYHVWVSSYDITHGRRMSLAFHKGNVLRRIELEAQGCRFFHGRLEGGPYRLVCDTKAIDDPPHPPRTECRLYDAGGEFEMVCETILEVRRFRFEEQG